jgi:hypothetical protein
MERSSLVIRSRGPRGYAAAILLGFRAIWTGLGDIEKLVSVVENALPAA